MKKYSVFLLLLIPLLAIAALPGCGGGNTAPMLESEKRLAGMYEACQTIKVTDPQGERPPIKSSELVSIPKVEVNAVLKRSNGAKIPGVWAGPALADVLQRHGVNGPFKELRIEAWDGYVARVGFDVATKPDTILAYLENGKKLPREDGPLRLVVASQDGFYWIRMITGLEIIR